MNGNSNHTGFGLVVESEVPTHPKDGRLRSGPRAPAASVDSRALMLSEKLRIGDNGMSRLLTVGEVAALLNVPRKWVYRRVGLKPQRACHTSRWGNTSGSGRAIFGTTSND